MLSLFESPITHIFVFILLLMAIGTFIFYLVHSRSKMDCNIIEYEIIANILKTYPNLLTDAKIASPDGKMNREQFIRMMHIIDQYGIVLSVEQTKVLEEYKKSIADVSRSLRSKSLV